jgi:Leucine-rich repeat (LRR) protein
LGQIIEAIGSKRQEEDASGDSKAAAQLKYRKFKYVESSSINELHAMNIELNEIPSWMIYFSNLKILNLRGNSISKIEEAALSLLSPKLTYLDMGSNKLTEVDLSFFPKLNYVQIFNNQISKINLSNLEYL